MQRRTIDQRIAELESQIGRLRQTSRKLENGQKIILGSMVLAEAEADPQFASKLLTIAEKRLARDIDRKRLEPVIARLKGA